MLTRGKSRRENRKPQSMKSFSKIGDWIRIETTMANATELRGSRGISALLTSRSFRSRRISRSAREAFEHGTNRSDRWLKGMIVLRGEDVASLVSVELGLSLRLPASTLLNATAGGLRPTAEWWIVRQKRRDTALYFFNHEPPGIYDFCRVLHGAPLRHSITICQTHRLC